LHSSNISTEKEYVILYETLNIQRERAEKGFYEELYNNMF